MLRVYTHEENLAQRRGPGGGRLCLIPLRGTTSFSDHWLPKAVFPRTPLVSTSRASDADRSRLTRFLSGEDAVTRELEDVARGVVVRRAFRLDPATQDDLVQQTLTQLWAACAREGFALETALDAFVRTIATARCIDHFRRQRWQVEIDESLPAQGEDPLEEIHRERTLLAVRKAVATLRPLCQELVRRHFHGGERYEDMAHTMGKAASTLRVQMFRCLRQLRVSLGLEAGTP